MTVLPLICYICETPMLKGGGDSARQGKAAHHSCRATVHGASRYKSGCRCDVCKAAKAVAQRKYSAGYRERRGMNYSSMWRRQFREENGYWPNRRGSDWIDPKLRGEIYERDGWACYLCELPVDREGDPNGNAAPSLDHVTPKSLGGSDDPANLKTACRSCNSRKGVSVSELLEV